MGHKPIQQTPNSSTGIPTIPLTKLHDGTKVSTLLRVYNSQRTIVPQTKTIEHGGFKGRDKEGTEKFSCM